MYPRLVVDTAKIAANVRTMTALLAERGLDCVGVTKGFCGDERIARILVENGVAAIGDSRLDNLEKLQGLDCEKWLIRMPQISDAARVVRLADLSVNTEPATIRALDAAAAEAGVTHKVLLMYDLGDLREGFVDRRELMEAAELCTGLEHIELAGVGANLTCLYFVQADRAKMDELCSVAAELRKRFGVEGMHVSAGNSATLKLMLEEGLPKGVTGLRLGEALMLGRERAGYEYLPGTFNDAFIVEAEVIEVKRKPSKPFGTLGPDSYGVVHEPLDRGERVRAILSAGHADIDIEVMWPLDERITLEASSSDHTIVDITDAAGDYAVGSVVRLRCGYHAVLHASASPYVETVYV